MFSDLQADARDVRYDVFGVPVTLPSLAVVTGIFKSPRALTDLEKKRGGVSPVELIMVQPQLELRDEDAVGLTRGSVVIIDGKSYVIDNLIPDGEGETVIQLAPESDASSGPEGWR